MLQDKAWFIKILENKDLVEKLKKITLIISDIDGSLTDGKGYYSTEDGIEKNFSIQDGFLMAKCNKENTPHLALISGRSDKAAEKRAHVLGIPNDLYFQGIDQNKSVTVIDIQQKLGVTKEETLFFGDDILDIETKDVVGIFASPANALFYVHDNSEIITPRVSGDGAFRMILDILFYVQEKHVSQNLISKSLQM